MRSKFGKHAAVRRYATELSKGVFAVGCVAAFLACPARATTPGTPGTPQPATPIFIENFQNSDPTTWIRLTAYAPDISGTGSTPNLPPKPAGETYTADAPWLTACNGMVLSFNSGGATPAECGAGGWDSVRQLAQALGEVDGMTQAAARQNLAIAAFTQANPGANLTQFRTSVDVPFLAPSTRFVTFSVDAAAVSCTAAHPAFQFAIFSGAGAPIPVGNTLDPCAAGTPTEPVDAIGGNTARDINAARFSTNQSYAFTGTSLGVLMRNAQGSGGGNDAAFDNIRIYDATPQLDKAFVPSVIAVGGTSTLTLTITNTDELASKVGLSFTDTLPSGLTIATPAALSNSCGGTATAVAGSTSLSLSGGSLAAGAASCSVTVHVAAGAEGLFFNGPGNVTAVGLNPPGSATLAAMSTLGTSCPRVPIYTNTGAGALRLQVWDPNDGSELGSIPLNEVYGDIAITADGSTVYGAHFTEVIPDGQTIDRIDAATGAVIESFVITGAMATDGVAAINGLSVRGDGQLLVGSYLSNVIYVVDPATGVSTQLGASFPVDVVSAGDFVTLPDGDILALGALPDSSVAAYRIKPDLSIFEVGTVGSTFGAAMSGGDAYLIGSAGDLYRVESIPTTASTDPLPVTLVVDTGEPFYGAASVQDAGDSVCHPTVLTLQKTWAGAQVGDAISMEADIGGNLVDSMDSVVATANQTTTDTTPITVYGGDVVAFSETFTAGSAANYSSSLACTGNANALVGNALTIGAADTSVVCTYTNAGLSTDLAITKTDGSATYIAGSPITYTIVASNAGPSDVTGATVVDTVPASIVNPTWTCVGAGSATCPASGTGSINASVNIPVGGSATFTVTGTISASTSGNLVNTATIAPPAGMTDPAMGNNSATDTDIAAGSPFVCDVSTIFVGQGSPTQLDAAVYGAGGTATFNPIGPVSAWIYNAVAYRDADRYLYAISQAEDAAHPIGHLLRIDPTTGSVVDLGLITGPLATSGANIGAFDASDNYWIAISAGTAIYRVNLTTRVATAVNLVPSQAINVSDFTYANGFLWGVVNSAQTLVRVDPATGNISQFPIPILPSGTYGAIWTFGNGNLGFSNNATGVIYQIAVANPAGTPTLTLVSSSPGPSSGNNDGTACIAPPVDLSIVKTGPATAAPGGALSWNLVVTNNGPGASSGFTVSDTVPAGVTGVASPTPGCTVAGNTVTCVGGGLASGATFTITITGNAPNPFATAITNTAVVTGNEQDPNPANDTAAETVSPSPPQLVVSKTATPNPFVVGQSGSYAITVQNTGTGPTTAPIVIADSLPSGIAFVSAAGAGWSCTGSATLSCTFAGTLAAGASTTLTIDVTVGAAATSGDNSATASGGGDPGCPAAGRCTGTVVVPISSVADLSITKTDGSATYAPGSPITYTIVAGNAGPSIAVDATVTDTLPAAITGATWTAVYSAGASGPLSGAGNINATVTIPAGGTATFTVTGTVDASASGPLSNTATVAPPSGTTDPVPGNNSATDTDTQGPQLTVVKSATPNPFVVGQSASYAITVTNAGGTPTSAPIAIADTLPAGITLTTFGGANWTCTGTTVLSCAFSGTLAAGASTTLTLDVDVAASAANGNNTATASGGGDPSCPAATHCVGTVAVPVTPAADIAVLKTVDNAAPNVGEQITFTVTATNNGPSDATGVQITDAMPSGLVFVSASPSQGTYDDTTGLWAVGSLADGASATLDIAATVIATGTLTNTATRTGGDQLDPNPSNNSASSSLNGQPSADIVVLKTVDNAAPNVGSDVTYTITATNAGPDDATGVVLTDELPAGLSLLSASPSQGTFDSASGEWTIGAIANGESVTLTITATVMQAGDITNIASVSHADQFDPNPSNNSAGVTIDGQSADIQVVKTVDNANPTVGDTITFTIVTTNNGPDAATGVEVTEALPSQLTLVSATPSVGSYDDTTGVWTIGGLNASGPGATATLTVIATVTTDGAFSNTATVTGSDQPDPNPSNNTSTVSILGDASADLSVVKTGPANAVPGANVTYTLAVTNAGPSTATSVSLADPTPAGLTFVSADAPCAAGFPCALGDIAAGASVTVTVTFAVPSDESGNIVNTATVTSPTSDPDPSNNTSTVTTPTSPQADVAVTKSGPATATPGGNVVYTIVVQNFGPSDAANVVVADPTPAGLVFVSNAGACTTAYPCAIGALAGGSSATITTTYSLPANYSGANPIVNTASASSDTPDPDTTNNQSSVQTGVGPGNADLAITKTGPATVAAGGAISYTLLIVNNGPSPANGASYSDVVPTGITGITASCAGEQGGAACGSPPSVSGSTVAGTIATLPSNGSVLITIDGTAPQGAQTLSNSATVAPPSGVNDPDPSNNEDSVDTTVVVTPASADLAVVKTGPASTVAGGNAIYTIVVTNNGPDAAANVVVADPTPAGLVFVSNTGACTTAYPCAIGTLASGASATITTTYAVPTTYTGPNPIVNTASVGSDTPDPNASNNSSTVTTLLTVAALGADIVVIKTGPASASAGETISYAIQVVNHGPDAVPDAVLSDPTPPGLEYVSATAPCASGFPCSLPPLANGASVAFTVTYTVQAGYTGTIANVANAVSPTVPDPVPENNSSTATTPVGGNPPASNVPVPIDARWMLMLITVLLTFVAISRLRARL